MLGSEVAQFIYSVTIYSVSVYSHIRIILQAQILKRQSIYIIIAILVHEEFLKMVLAFFQLIGGYLEVQLMLPQFLLPTSQKLVSFYTII